MARFKFGIHFRQSLILPQGVSLSVNTNGVRNTVKRSSHRHDRQPTCVEACLDAKMHCANRCIMSRMGLGFPGASNHRFCSQWGWIAESLNVMKPKSQDTSSSLVAGTYLSAESFVQSSDAMISSGTETASHEVMDYDVMGALSVSRPIL